MNTDYIYWVLIVIFLTVVLYYVNLIRVWKKRPTWVEFSKNFAVLIGCTMLFLVIGIPNILREGFIGYLPLIVSSVIVLSFKVTDVGSTNRRIGDNIIIGLIALAMFYGLTSGQTWIVNSVLFGSILGYFSGNSIRIYREVKKEEDGNGELNSLNQNKTVKEVLIELPNELKTSLQQYLIFFKEYVETAKGVKIEFNIIQVEQGLQITLKKNKDLEMNEVQTWLDEYISFTKSNIDNTVINVENKLSNAEIDLLKIKLENQISHLKNNLKTVEFENNFLRENNHFLKNLALAFSNKDNVIHNQYIQGGSQQFANSIENQKSTQNENR